MENKNKESEEQLPFYDGISRIDDSTEETDDKTKVYVYDDPGDEVGDILSMGVCELNGVSYRIVRMLSKDSGESQIYEVELEQKSYILKLYYPHFSPDKELQAIIKNMNFEMIVKVYDYGVLTVGTSTRAYEIMEYLRGGNLKHFTLNKDFATFKRLAYSAAAALYFCHKNHIIHKDIKPSNFFFRDEEHRQLVLGDFGISSLGSASEIRHKTSQSRTPVYAAPEMYNLVLDGEVEITHKVDFYSLGLSLLFLWIGKNPFSGDERSIMRMKTEGTIPGLEHLPTPVKTLIQGLTLIQPEKRWGYEEVERWYQGEYIETKDSVSLLKYSPFIFDADRSLTAKDPKELAHLLKEDKELGIKYLYNKKITRWLEEGGNQKISVELEEIITKRFPSERSAGIVAAIYVLDAEFPYYDVAGEKCTNKQELAASLKEHAAKYERLLKEKNNDFYLFLEAKGETEAVKRFRQYFKTNPPHVALWRIIYEIDPEMPFLSSQASSTIPEIIKAFSTGNCNEDEWQSLIDGRLLSWLSDKGNPLLYREIDTLTQRQVFSTGLAYGVLYHLDRTCGFDLQNCKTQQQIGELLSHTLQAAQHQNDDQLRRTLNDYIEENGKLTYYCKAHRWENVLSFRAYCFNLHSKENTERSGIYTLRIACYKFCEGLGGMPAYWIKEQNISLYALSDLDKVAAGNIEKEMKTGSLKSWLTLFFHENNHAKFENPYDYEKSLQAYLLKVGQYDRSDRYYQRFIKAQGQTLKKTEKGKSLLNRTRFSEILLILLLALSGAALSGLIVHYGISDLKLFQAKYYDSVCLPIGIIGFFLSLYKALRNADGLLSVVFLTVLGCLFWLTPAIGAKWLFTHYPDNYKAICIGTLGVYVFIFYLIGFKNSIFKQKGLQIVLRKDIKFILLEPLYYTYRSTAQEFRGSSSKALTESIRLIKESGRITQLRYLSGITLICLFIGEFLYFHPQLHNAPLPDVSLEKTIDSLNIKQYINQVVEEKDDLQKL